MDRKSLARLSIISLLPNEKVEELKERIDLLGLLLEEDLTPKVRQTVELLLDVHQKELRRRKA